MDVGNEDKGMKVVAQTPHVGKLVDGSTTYYHRDGGNRIISYILGLLYLIYCGSSKRKCPPRCWMYKAETKERL